MLQESASAPQSTDRSGVWATQAVRILGLALALDLIVQRGLSQGAIGLRLRVDAGWLDHASEWAQAVGPHLRTALLLASVLVALVVPWPLLRRSGLTARLAALGCAGVALWCLAWRIDGARIGTPMPGIVTPFFLLGAWTWVATRRAPRRTAPILVTTLGAALCTTWFLIVGGAQSAGLVARISEMSGEILLLTGAAAALPLAAAVAPRRPLAPLIVAGLVIAGALAAWGVAPEAFLHLVRHVFMVRQAGLPGAVVALLMAAAMGSLAGLLMMGRAWRGDALVLIALVASARSPDAEILALRAATVILLIRLAAGSSDRSAP